MGYILGIFAYFLLSVTAYAATITVDGGGHKAIVEAVQAAGPGDVIKVLPGNYDNDNQSVPLVISKSGTSSQSIRLTSATKHAAKLGNISFDNASYWILDGFEITPKTKYQTSYGTITIEGGRNIVIRNMRIHHVRMGVQVKSGTNHTIENSVIYENINTSGSNHHGAHSVEVHRAKNTTIRGNTFYGFIADGVQLYIPSNGSPVNRGTTVIANNKIYNTKGYCAENAVDIKGESGTVIIRNNVMYGFRLLDKDNQTGKNPQGCPYWASGSPAGIAINAHNQSSGQLMVEQNEFYDMASALVHNGMKATFQNNIVHDFISEQPLWGVGSSHYSGVFNLNGNIKILHNTFVDVPRLTHTYNGSNSGADIANNLFYDVRNTPGNNSYRYNGWFGGSDRQAGTGDVTTGSLGMDFSTYKLNAGSALIDQALALGVKTDFTGGSRPVGPVPDIGAYEYRGQGGGDDGGGDGGSDTCPVTTALGIGPDGQVTRFATGETPYQKFNMSLKATSSRTKNAAALNAILDTLYRFRDEVMRQSALGRRYIRKFYQHAWEASWLLVGNPDLRADVAAALDQMHPVLQARVEGESAVFTSKDIRSFESLLTAIHDKASAKLRRTIRSLRSDMRSGKLWRVLGIEVE